MKNTKYTIGSETRARRKKTFYIILSVIVSALTIIAFHFIMTSVMGWPLITSLYILVPIILIILPGVIVGTKCINRDIGYYLFNPHKLKSDYNLSGELGSLVLKLTFPSIVMMAGSMFGFYFTFERGQYLEGILSFIISAGGGVSRV